MKNNQLKRYNFKLYLEGEEIPFRSIVVSHNDTTTFNVTIPPYHEAFHLKPNTYGFMIFKEKEVDTKWKMLCEGIYIGNGYSKRPNDRNVTLKFKDVKWFYDSTKLYDIIAASKLFGPAEAAFFGDTRYENMEGESVETVPNVNFEGRMDILNSFREDAARPIEGFIDHILGNFLKGNEFIKEYAEKYRLNGERIRVLENPQTKEIFGYRVLEDIYNGILNESTTMTNVIDLIYSLAQIIQYDLKPVPGFLKEEGSSTIQNYIMKPNLNFTAPPACNVIFPNENTSFNYQKDETQIKTRYRLVDDIFGEKSYGYYAPFEIHQGFYDDKGTRGHITDEEKFKGVIPYQTTLPLSQTLAIGFQESKLNEQIGMKQKFVNYMYYKEKYKTVPLSVEVAFKPDILIGFPVLIVDDEIPMVGYLVSATHNVNPESGYATTTLTLSHVYPLSERVPQLEGWYSTEVFGINEIDSLYRTFGTKSCFKKYDSDIEIDSEGMFSFERVINALKKDYDETDDKLEFQKGFRRDLPTFYDEEGGESMMSQLGLRKSQNKFSGGPLNIGLSATINGETRTVSQFRLERVRDLKRRMQQTSPRKFSEGGNN